MTETATIRELKSTYPGEWILLDQITQDPLGEIATGVVRLHHSNREEFDRKLLEFRPNHSAILFIDDAEEESNEIYCPLLLEQ